MVKAAWASTASTVAAAGADQPEWRQQDGHEDQVQRSGSGRNQEQGLGVLRPEQNLSVSGESHDRQAGQHRDRCNIGEVLGVVVRWNNDLEDRQCEQCQHAGAQRGKPSHKRGYLGKRGPALLLGGTECDREPGILEGDQEADDQRPERVRDLVLADCAGSGDRLNHDSIADRQHGLRDRVGDRGNAVPESRSEQASIRGRTPQRLGKAERRDRGNQEGDRDADHIRERLTIDQQRGDPEQLGSSAGEQRDDDEGTRPLLRTEQGQAGADDGRGQGQETPSSTGPGSSGESAGAQISPVRRIGQTTAAAIRAALMISERPAVAPSAFL